MAEAKKATKKAAEVSEETTIVATEAPTQETIESNPEVHTAKAGKRSVKGIEAAEAKAEKIEKQQHRAEEAARPKQHKNPTRTKAERAGKRFKAAYALIENDKEYSMKEALDLAIKTSTVKFDATVEIHINLGVDPKQADQNIRDNFVLPAGTGKAIRVAVFAEADDAAKAKKAGADIAGIEELVADLDKGIINFDTLIATPTTMAKLGKYARTLGPKGLMPNPKSGTVTADVEKAVKDAKAGKVEYRVDSTGIVHLGVGKVSFGADKLMQNVKAVAASIRAAKPASSKGTYVKVVHITTSMGPSIRVATSEL